MRETLVSENGTLNTPYGHGYNNGAVKVSKTRALEPDQFAARS
jgi:hypothetical protein